MYLSYCTAAGHTVSKVICTHDMNLNNHLKAFFQKEKNKWLGLRNLSSYGNHIRQKYSDKCRKQRPRETVCFVDQRLPKFPTWFAEQQVPSTHSSITLKATSAKPELDWNKLELTGKMWNTFNKEKFLSEWIKTVRSYQNNSLVKMLTNHTHSVSQCNVQDDTGVEPGLKSWSSLVCLSISGVKYLKNTETFSYTYLPTLAQINKWNIFTVAVDQH